MFSAYCDRCESEVLLSSRRIVSLQHTGCGIVVLFRCWDGHLGSWLTGRRAGTGEPGTAEPEEDRTGAPTAGSEGDLAATGRPRQGRSWSQPRVTDVWREPRPARI